MSSRSRPGWLQALGPGILVAATGVGAGDLVAAAVSGASYGYALLWTAVAGAFLKFALTDGIARFMDTHPVYAHALEGVRYDCGSRLGMLKANLDYALADEVLRPELRRHLQRALAVPD